jgi:hypothetical protein
MDKVFFDYRNNRKTRSSSRTVELGPWLEIEANKRNLYDMRLFYVLKPVADDVVKFGIAGLTGKSSSWGRLHQYINEYGYRTDLNQCSGIDLLYLAGTRYNPNVETTNTQVYKKELACKQYFRDSAIKGRGFERILQERLDELFKIIDDKSNKSFEDIETDRRTSERLQQAEIMPDDKVIRIVSHETKAGKSKALTKYKVQWSRPYILTEKKRIEGKIVTTTKEVDTTEEFYKNIVTFLDGGKAIEVYKALHPSGNFRD